MKIKTELKFILENLGIKEDVKIHRITISFNKINIYLERPGLFIGKAGETYKKIKEQLSSKKEIKLIEFNPFN